MKIAWIPAFQMYIFLFPWAFSICSSPGFLPFCFYKPRVSPTYPKHTLSFFWHCLPLSPELLERAGYIHCFHVRSTHSCFSLLPSDPPSLSSPEAASVVFRQPWNCSSLRLILFFTFLDFLAAWKRWGDPLLKLSPSVTSMAWVFFFLNPTDLFHIHSI